MEGSNVICRPWNGARAEGGAKRSGQNSASGLGRKEGGRFEKMLGKKKGGLL